MAIITLALAARKLVRIALEPRLGLGDAHLGQQIERARAPLPGQPLMQEQDFADLLLDGVERLSARSSAPGR